MKVSGILALFYLQASASFIDKIRSAIFDVERGVGKLVTDVVTDVQDTIHCTLSAVEQVLLKNGLLDKTGAYNYRCRDLNKYHTEPYDERSHRSLLDTSKDQKHQKDKKYNNKKYISMELENSIANTNKKIDNILRHSSSDLDFESEILKKDTDRLAEISDVLKKELQNLSSNVRSQIRDLEYNLRDTGESIWGKIKALHELQQKNKNEKEANEIRHVLNTVVKKLGMTTNNKNANIYNLEDIKKHLISYKQKDIQPQNNQNKMTNYLKLNQLEPITVMPKTFNDAHNIFNRNNTQVRPREEMNQIFKHDKKSSAESKSVFDLSVDGFDYFTPFSTGDSNHKETVANAMKIIKDSQLTDKALNNLFHSQKPGVDVFSNSDLFNFNKK